MGRAAYLIVVIGFEKASDHDGGRICYRHGLIVVSSVFLEEF